MLYKDYHSDKKFTISTYSPTGVAITSSGTKKGELFLGDVNTQLKNKNITTNIKVDTNSNHCQQTCSWREGPGKCFRLYPENEFEKLEDSTMPEIKRCNLANVILQLKALGVDDILGFDFIKKPSRTAIVKSLEQLFLLGALTDECQLSDLVGWQMARLPLGPIHSKATYKADEVELRNAGAADFLVVSSRRVVEN
ncbi:hypothetical protein KIW84_057684 [Lathyrus oleraceus]|uniref:RNA helicase n=1 Tax=Pisum sativum TaxID=3888 RepID=A0A9D4X3T9_PEA|nr:hypothetical protein KIW84_057684 [Pisum sativum]